MSEQRWEYARLIVERETPPERSPWIVLFVYGGEEIRREEMAEGDDLGDAEHDALQRLVREGWELWTIESVVRFEGTVGAIYWFRRAR